MSLLAQAQKVDQASSFVTRLEAIVGQPVKEDSVRINIDWADADQAQAHLEDINRRCKELRQLKKDVNQQIKKARSSYAARRGAVNASLLARIGGAKRAASSVASRREKIRREEESVVAALLDVCKTVDQAMEQLEAVEGQINVWLQEQR